jgi:hypothetical protein
MSERLRFVAEQQGDVAGLGLLLQQAQAQTGAIDRIGILPALQRVARPAPGKAPSHGVVSVKSAQMVIAALLGGTDPRLEPVLNMRPRRPHHLTSGRALGSDHNPSCLRASGSGRRDHPF